jgi:hypothetical protein
MLFDSQSSGVSRGTLTPCTKTLGEFDMLADSGRPTAIGDCNSLLSGMVNTGDMAAVDIDEFRVRDGIVIAGDVGGLDEFKDVSQFTVGIMVDSCCNANVANPRSRPDGDGSAGVASLHLFRPDDDVD